MYTLILKFCELYFTEVGRRVFNINFGDKVVVENIDIVKEVGYMSALDVYIEFEFSEQDQSIYFEG